MIFIPGWEPKESKDDTQAELMKECKELLSEIAWSRCSCTNGHKTDCFVDRASILLDRLEAATEGM